MGAGHKNIIQYSSASVVGSTKYGFSYVNESLFFSLGENVVLGVILEGTREE